VVVGVGGELEFGCGGGIEGYSENSNPFWADLLYRGYGGWMEDSRYAFPRTALFIQSITRSTWPRHRAIAGLLLFVVFQLSGIQPPPLRQNRYENVLCAWRTAFGLGVGKKKLAQFNRDVFLDAKIERENL